MNTVYTAKAKNKDTGQIICSVSSYTKSELFELLANTIGSDGTLYPDSSFEIDNTVYYSCKLVPQAEAPWGLNQILTGSNTLINGIESRKKTAESDLSSWKSRATKEEANAKKHIEDAKPYPAKCKDYSNTIIGTKEESADVKQAISDNKDSSNSLLDNIKNFNAEASKNFNAASSSLNTAESYADEIDSDIAKIKKNNPNVDMHIDMTTGELIYNDECVFVFSLNCNTGELMYERKEG